MNTHDQILEKSLRAYIDNTSPPTFQDVVKAIQDDLEVLADDGIISLGPDIGLSGTSLEIRTKLIISGMGFTINKGREGLEDFVVLPSEDMNPKDPLVLEVKSSRKPNISRDNLRQLDDWVFDLSGEEKARKHGLGGGLDTLSYASGGMMSSRKKHPSPHKGVLIFNGPIGVPFEDRPPTSVGYNEIDFIHKRNFCIIPFYILLDCFEKYQDRPEISVILCNKIHSTIGELERV